MSSFTEDTDAQLVSDLLRELGINRATGFALVKSLVERGYLERVQHGHVRLGHKARSLLYTPLERPAETDVRRIKGLTKTTASAGQLLNAKLDPDLLRTVKPNTYARPGPWKIAFANASLGNAWRRALKQSVQYGVSLHKESVGVFRTEVAHDDAVRQADQIKAMLAEGLDALIVSATPDPQGHLNAVLQQARQKNVAIVALDRRPRERRLITSFVTASDHMIGGVSALWISEMLAGQGRVWMLSGLEASSPTKRRATSALAMFGAFGQVEVTAHVHTNWTAQSGFDLVTSLIDKGAEPPDAVWCDSGLQGLGSVQAFEAAQLAIPPHTGGDLNGMYKRALDLRLPHCALDYPAAMGALAVSVALDLLRGRAVPRRVEAPVPVIMSRGAETDSVRADMYAEHHVRWDLPDVIVLSQGLALRNSQKGDAA